MAECLYLVYLIWQDLESLVQLICNGASYDKLGLYSREKLKALVLKDYREKRWGG